MCLRGLTLWELMHHVPIVMKKIHYKYNSIPFNGLSIIYTYILGFLIYEMMDARECSVNL